MTVMQVGLVGLVGAGGRAAADTARAGRKLRRPADLDHAPGLHDHDEVGGRHETEPVRHDHDGPQPRQTRHRIADDRLALGVEVRRRLVEDDQPGVGQEGAGDGDPLALPAAEADSVLADGRRVARPATPR